jgi:hypothetical protein
MAMKKIGHKPSDSKQTHCALEKGVIEEWCDIYTPHGIKLSFSVVEKAQLVPMCGI